MKTEYVAVLLPSPIKLTAKLSKHIHVMYTEVTLIHVYFILNAQIRT